MPQGDLHDAGTEPFHRLSDIGLAAFGGYCQGRVDPVPNGSGKLLEILSGCLNPRYRPSITVHKAMLS